MENNTNHDSASDSPNQAEKHVNTDETSENREETLENEIAKEMSENSEEHERNTADTSAGKEEHVAGETKAMPAGDEQLCLTSGTPVDRISSAGNSDKCHIPPTRPKRKSRTNSDTPRPDEEEKGKQEEKAHGDRGESEGQAEEEKVLEDKEESESEGKEEKEENGDGKESDDQEKEEKEKDGEKKREEASSTNTGREENGKVSAEKEENQIQGTQTDKHEDIKPTPTRRNRKKNTLNENPQTKEDKNLNLEEGKRELTENEKKKKKMEEEEGEKRHLVGMKKELGLVNCVGIIVGNIIGTGIFISPGAVLQYTGSVGMSLIVWIVSGLATIVGALVYCELGTMIPQSGGNYTYLHEAFGPLPAFLYVWMFVMVGMPGGRAVVALSFANYVTQPFFPDGSKPPEAAVKMIGILLILALTFVNTRRVRWATRVQDSLALLKVVALIMIIVVGLFHLSRGTTDNYEDPMEGTVTNPTLIAIAFYHTFFAYDGWDSLNGIMEELKDPFRNMPRAIAISVITVMIIYVLTNVAYFAVLPKELILSSPAVAVTFGNLALGVMAWTIPIFVACSIMGGLNGSLLLGSRLLYVSARRGQLPRALSLVHVNNSTPITSLVFMAGMSMIMFMTSDVRVLINYLGFTNNLMVLACIGSFFWFRVKEPDLARPIKVWIGFPVIYIVLSACLCVFPVVQQPFQVLAALVILGTGVPVYYLLVKRQKKPECLATAMGTMIPQSGGNYTYLHEAFGPLPAFLYVWMFVMVGMPGSRAVVALSFANYVTQPFFPDGSKPPEAAVKMIAILLILALTFVNTRRVRWATRVQDSLALLKVVVLIMIIVVGLFHLSRGTTDNYEDPMEGTVTNPSLVALAFYHTFYAYEGWDSLNEIMEELKDPSRNMPRAIAISVITVIIIYVLTNVAYFAVLPKELMLSSPAVAVTFGNLALGVMASTIPIFVACSIMGGLNGLLLLGSRILYVSARRGQLPRALSLVHVNNSTPITSLVFMAGMSMIMFMTSDVRVLINYMGFTSNLMGVACIGSFFWFRVKKPDLARPIKVWIGFPVIYIVLSACLCVFPVVQQPLQVLAALVILGTGIPVYYLLVKRQKKPECLATAMGTMIPQSGGNYTYLHEAFGPLPAFLYVWMFVMVGMPGSRAVVALSFANYVTQPFFPDGSKPPEAAVKMIAILLILALTFVNTRRVRWATRVQDSLALLKVVVLIMIIVVGLFHLSRGTTDNYEDPMEGTVTNPSLVALAFYHTFYAYEGWDSLNEIMEELKDPSRNMPRAIAISVITVIIIYVLTNVAYFAVLPKELMLSSPAVAVTFGNLALGVMASTIPIFVACSIMGGLNGLLLLGSRILYVSARRGQLPRALSLVHVNNSTPITSLVFMAGMSMIMFMTSDVRVLINYMGFTSNLMGVACIGSFFWFRVKKPDLARPIKVWIGFPVIYIVLSACLCVFPVVQQPWQALAALVILGTGIPVYYLLVKRQKKPECLATAMDKITFVCQVLFMAAPEETGT
ncbi:uncharacterized protein LOC126999491 [Eriocheir sinensis]|uniref:uncharacterized protein LOC126999491 n=1 Tax=Eriocheir sinensis TaxID=95602 RepID=UPI0021C98F8B|nr:uncharacterized protein LOC126999491 [Eriocheir sinensis]